jgi:hypothetical protein
MRNGQNKRMRGRNNHHRKNQNPMSRVFESNGPDVKIRGNPAHIAEKYVQLARDAQASGDPISAENYYQHAEHYYRLIAAAQEQFRQNNPYMARTDFDQSGGREDAFDGPDEDSQGMGGGEEAPFGTREPQPYVPRESQPFNQAQPYGRSREPNGQSGDTDRLPSFITGAQPQSQAPQQSYQSHQQNGHDNQGDRFPLHRRRRRHRGGPRQDYQGQGNGAPGDTDDSTRGD